MWMPCCFGFLSLLLFIGDLTIFIPLGGCYEPSIYPAWQLLRGRVVLPLAYVYDCARFAGIAQLVEQRIRNAQVMGSSPFTGSTTILYLSAFSFKTAYLGGFFLPFHPCFFTPWLYHVCPPRSVVFYVFIPQFFLCLYTSISVWFLCATSYTTKKFFIPPPSWPPVNPSSHRLRTCS